jgi:hypothetical protein
LAVAVATIVGTAVGTWQWQQSNKAVVPVAVDADADGYPASVDCNDADGNIYPGVIYNSTTMSWDTSIQDAVDNASDTDVLYICGDFTESVEIDGRELTLIGYGYKTNISSGAAASAPVFDLISSDVTFNNIMFDTSIMTSSPYQGSVIYADSSQVNLLLCRFVGDSHAADGGIVHGYNSGIDLIGSRFLLNSGGDYELVAEAGSVISMTGGKLSYPSTEYHPTPYLNTDATSTIELTNVDLSAVSGSRDEACVGDLEALYCTGYDFTTGRVNMFCDGATATCL